MGNAEVEQFLREKNGPIFQGTNKVLILDNAANQRIETCMNTLEECVEGRFSYLSEYSPELNPAERGVSLVRRWICNEEYNYRFRSPIEPINDAFLEYSLQGQLGRNCYHFFDLYR